MCQIAINIPNEVLFDTHMNQRDAAAFAKRMVALGYYVDRKVSIGYCAEIAGMTEEEFLIFLSRQHVGIFEFDDEAELLQDIENA